MNFYFEYAKFHENNLAKSLSFSDIGKSIPCHEFLMSQICVLMLFAKIQFLQKFLNLQYLVPISSQRVKFFTDIEKILLTFLNDLSSSSNKHSAWLIKHIQGDKIISYFCQKYMHIFRPSFKHLLRPKTV